MKRWHILPPAIPLTWIKSLPSGTVFLKWFIPHCFTHTHKQAQWLWEPNCSRHIIVTDLSTSRSFSTDHIQPQTFFVKHPRRIWADSVQGKGLHADLVTQCTEAKNAQSFHRARITPANWSICTLTSIPVPNQNQICKMFQLWRCQGEKSKAEDRTVLSRSKILWGDSWQSAALEAELKCWAGSPSTNLSTNSAGSGLCQASLTCPFHHDCSALGSWVQMNGMCFAICHWKSYYGIGNRPVCFSSLFSFLISTEKIALLCTGGFLITGQNKLTPVALIKGFPFHIQHLKNNFTRWCW